MFTKATAAVQTKTVEMTYEQPPPPPLPPLVTAKEKATALLEIESLLGMVLVDPVPAVRKEEIDVGALLRSSVSPDPLYEEGMQAMKFERESLAQTEAKEEDLIARLVDPGAATPVSTGES